MLSFKAQLVNFLNNRLYNLGKCLSDGFRRFAMSQTIENSVLDWNSIETAFYKTLHGQTRENVTG